MVRRFTRSRRRVGGRGARASRRKLTWVSGTFQPEVVLTANNLTFQIATEAQLLALTLGRGTVAVLYGRIKLYFQEAVVQGTFSVGAWGIRLKETDSPATLTAFSPVADSESTEWMTWRGFSIFKTTGAGTGSGGAIANEIDEEFVIRNPRKIDTDEGLVMIIENAAASTATLTVNFWVRAGILLP